MAADGQVVFEIVGDSSNVDKTVKQVTSNIQQESKKWDQAASGATSDIEKSFASMAGKIVGTLAAAGIGAILMNWGKAAIDAASDLSEVQNVVDTVFGDGAKRIETWAQKAGQQFGLTELQAKKFTSTLGAMMKSSGLAGDEIISMSTDLAGLAADMASFYNLDFETAFEKIRSGISGETMPLKQLGINMSVANLEAFALAQGIEKTFSEMSQGEQTMLRYQYLMQATADAQGDFEKTSDGFANAQRRIQTSLESIETNIGNLLITPFENATAGVASFLEKISSSMTPERTIIDDFNDIEIDTAQKMAELQETYNKASDIIKLIDEIGTETVQLKDGSKISLESLFSELGNVEKNGGDVTEYLEKLGVDVDYVIQKYNVWKESTRQLTATVPSLTDVIDEETYSIDGGTEALQKNLDEWKAYQEKIIAWTAYYAKERALAEKKGELYMYEFDAGAARQAFDRIKKQLGESYGEGIVKGAIDWINTHGIENAEALVNGPHLVDATFAGLQIEDAQKLVEALKKEQKATEEWERQTYDYTEAEKELADGKQALIDKYGEEEEAAKGASSATTTLTDDMSLLERAMGGDADAAKELAGAWEDAGKALKAVSEYYKSVDDATKQAVDSTVKGFDKVQKATKPLEEQKEEIDSKIAKAETEYSKLLKSAGGFEKIAGMTKSEWNKLSSEVQNAYNELAKLKKEQDEVNKSLNEYKPEGMTANLQSQITFMEEYINNLNTLKEWGVSDALLASLSDGSKESAAYLQGLVEGGQDAAGEVGTLFDEVAQKKKEFTKDLTDTKLQADEAYQELIETAQEALGELNLHDEAKGSLKETVQGIADGVEEGLPSVHEAVNAVLSELNRLGAYGVNYEFDNGGAIETIYGGDHVLASGTDWIPYDNFPALLHKGEAVLSAAENQVWQNFKNGQQPQSMDYDALGGVMRENIHAGGDVYLEGRTVGKVLSDVQGNQYRALQRSGWQQ